MMTESRRQFEEWARKEGLHVNFIACDCFYDMRATETAWQAWQESWQASRAAVVFKLPDWFVSGIDAAMYRDDVIKALDEAGIDYE